METKLQRLMEANKIEAMSKRPDKERIADLEAENEDLRQQVREAQDALIELAEMIVEEED